MNESVHDMDIQEITVRKHARLSVFVGVARFDRGIFDFKVLQNEKEEKSLVEPGLNL